MQHEYVNKANALRGLEKLDEAISYVYYEQEDYNKALESYDIILGVEPKDAWAYFYKVDCYARLDRMDEAIQALKKATELDLGCMYDLYYLDEIEKIKNHKDFKTIFQ